MKQKVTLATIALHNTAGGLERNIVRIANYLATRGFDVHLLTFDLPGAVSFFPLDPAITWHTTGRTTPHTRISFVERLRLIKRIRNALKNHSDKMPNTLICFHHGLLLRCMLAAVGLGVNVICSERNALSVYQHVNRGKWNINFLLLFIVQQIVVQFDSYIRDYPTLLRHKITAIPNAVDLVSSSSNPAGPNATGRQTIFCQGRLCDQKNFASVITAFTQLADSYPTWDVVIRGEGPDLIPLQQQIEAAKLGARVTIKPNKPDISDDYASAQLFCMPSKWEGFPNAMAEAMAHGLPCVGFAGCRGVVDMIGVDEQRGWLAQGNGNSMTLMHTLRLAMDSANARQHKGLAARQYIGAFTPGVVLPQWDKLIGHASLQENN